MSPGQDSEGWFNYEFSFWFLVVSIIIIILGFIPGLYLLKYVGIVLMILIILIRFVKNVLEMDR